jgi:hypothetical protein
MTAGSFCTSVGSPQGDELTEIQHGHPVAQPHDERHAVLDEHNGKVELGAHGTDEIAEAALLVRVHAGRRLGEEEQIGLVFLLSKLLRSLTRIEAPP